MSAQTKSWIHSLDHESHHKTHIFLLDSLTEDKSHLSEQHETQIHRFRPRLRLQELWVFFRGNGSKYQFQLRSDSLQQKTDLVQRKKGLWGVLVAFSERRLFRGSLQYITVTSWHLEPETPRLFPNNLSWNHGDYSRSDEVTWTKSS